MPKLRTENFGPGDQTWLGSTHGIANCRTITLDPDAFAGSPGLANGYLRSGLPLTRLDSGHYGPYSGSQGQTFDGFLFTDQSLKGLADGEKINAPMLDHGRVRISRLPVTFSKPGREVDATTIVFI